MTCMVYDRKKYPHSSVPLNQDGGGVHVVTRKLDLDQTSMAYTHTERHNVIKLTFWLQVSIWMILMIFVTQEFLTTSLDITLRSSASAVVSA